MTENNIIAQLNKLGYEHTGYDTYYKDNTSPKFCIRQENNERFCVLYMYDSEERYGGWYDITRFYFTDTNYITDKGELYINGKFYEYI